MDRNIYKDMAKRTGGDIFVGVVGPVRTGKSTFRKGFMEQMMLPCIENEYDAKRARDEMPQAAAGRTVMTAEPKFIPDDAVNVTVGEGASFKMRLVDCVGYLVNGAEGHMEDGHPRMVKTPWQEEEMTFEQAAEIGTHKVIDEHSTVSLLVTCDGSFGDIPRESYVPAEERAVKDSAEQAGAKEVRLIHEPMAAAIGIGIDVLEPIGNMIVDIGGGTSEIAVIALGGIVNNKSIRTAGDDFIDDIVEYMRKQHNMHVGERTAEMIKIEVGSALTELENPPDEYAVHGRDMLTGIPKEIKVKYSEIAYCLDKSISKIETAVLNALEQTPPELSADIYRTGIYLTGGGALLRGLDKRLHAKTKLPIHVADDPLRAVARGTGIALKNFDKFPFLIK